MSDNLSIRSGAERVKVTVPEAAFAFIDLSNRPGRVGLDADHDLFEHRFRFGGCAELGICARTPVGTRSALTAKTPMIKPLSMTILLGVASPASLRCPTR